ncbi:MAG: hypothetical protein K8T91_25780 [Planctomycetes bacterium]|nr:hypothetical protein [Planctomycetota bacterium]
MSKAPTGREWDRCVRGLADLAAGRVSSIKEAAAITRQAANIQGYIANAAGLAMQAMTNRVQAELRRKHDDYRQRN